MGRSKIELIFGIKKVDDKLLKLIESHKAEDFSLSNLKACELRELLSAYNTFLKLYRKAFGDKDV